MTSRLRENLDITGDVTLDGYLSANNIISYDNATLGFVLVADLTARNALTKIEGLNVYVLSNQTTYALQSDLSTWTAAAGGGGLTAEDENVILAGQIFS